MNLKKLLSRRGAERLLKGAIRWELRKRGITEDSDYEDVINALVEYVKSLEDHIDAVSERLDNLIDKMEEQHAAN